MKKIKPSQIEKQWGEDLERKGVLGVKKSSDHKTQITKCPACSSRKFVISVFGSICQDCFYEER